MTCPACTSTKILPTCWFDLIIGTISPAKDVDIYVKNWTTGYVIKQALDDATEIFIDLTDPESDFYNPFNSYELWATERDDPTTRLPITLGDGTTVDTCFTVKFENQGSGQVGTVYSVPVAELILEVE